MWAGEIRRLAGLARIGPGVRVLDLWCGVGGPGRFLTAELDCRYLGPDNSASAVQIARRLAGDLPCHFAQARVPPLSEDSYEVVLLLETMLAFPDKRALLREVARVLEPGGRFAFTVEEGPPLLPHEWADMPDADTVWLVQLATAGALLRAFRTDSAAISRRIGTRAAAELIAAHQLWCDWLRAGRVRKFAVVAEKRRTEQG